jgi:hypothetical protein
MKEGNHSSIYKKADKRDFSNHGGISPFFCPGYIYMCMKLVRIISVDIDVMYQLPACFKNFKKWNTVGQALLYLVMEFIKVCSLGGNIFYIIHIVCCTHASI